jgi:hypothetical protein
VTERRIGPALRHAFRCRHIAERLLGVALAACKYPYAETIRPSLHWSGYGYQAITAGQFKLERRREAAGALLGVFETFPFWFNIVTP